MGAPLAVIDARSVGKATTAERLIAAVVANGWSFIIVKTAPSTKDRIVHGPILLSACGSALIYAVTDRSSLSAGVKCLVKMRMWHKPVFHILVVTSGTEARIAELCSANEESLAEIEQSVTGEVVCYIDPVDDQLELHGSQDTVDKLTGPFPSGVT